MATSLSFEQDGNEYVATATVSADYALHLEREDKGYVLIEQTHVNGGEYAQTYPAPYMRIAPKNFDHAFSHGVYPVYIKIRSQSAVTSGSIIETE